MNNRNSSKTGLFLMELILAVLLFAISGAICIQLFVNSHIISQKSVDLNHSILWAQNVAETFYACNGNVAEMSALFTDCSYDSDTSSEQLTLLFDKNFNSVSNQEENLCSYLLSATIYPDDAGLLICQISVRKTTDEETIYELQTTLFPAKEAIHD